MLSKGDKEVKGHSDTGKVLKSRRTITLIRINNCKGRWMRVGYFMVICDDDINTGLVSGFDRLMAVGTAINSDDKVYSVCQGMFPNMRNLQIISFG